MKRSIKLSLTLQIFLGLLIGAVAGKVLGARVIPFAGPAAELFIRLLQMTIMPLIITSILSGVLAVGASGSLLRLGMKTMIYFVVTTLLAIFTGQALVNIFQPGSGLHLELGPNRPSASKNCSILSSVLYRPIFLPPWRRAMCCR